MTNFPGQIHPSNSVTLNGNSTLNLIGSNTLASLNFGTTGGAGNPTVAIGSGYLTLAGTGMTVLNDNASQIAWITGTHLDLNNNDSFKIDVNGIAPLGIRIDPAIRNGGIVKTGTGSLLLNGRNVFAGGVRVDAGTLMLGFFDSLGTGRLTLGNDTTIMTTDGNGGTIGGITFMNPVTINGNVTFGGGYGTSADYRGNISLLGQITLAADSIMDYSEPLRNRLSRSDNRSRRHHQEWPWNPRLDGSGRQPLQRPDRDHRRHGFGPGVRRALAEFGHHHQLRRLAVDPRYPR